MLSGRAREEAQILAQASARVGLSAARFLTIQNQASIGCFRDA